MDLVTEEEFKELATENPYRGTAEQVVTISKAIYEVCTTKDLKTTRQYMDAAGIDERTLPRRPNQSKLKGIGATLSQLSQKDLKEVTRNLPDSYTIIQELCSLESKEVLTAVKSKTINRQITIRQARELVKLIRFPSLAGEMEKQESSLHGDPVITIYQSDLAPLDEHTITTLLQTIKDSCKGYDVDARGVRKTSISELRKQDRADREVFWRNALEKELTQEWFDGTDPDIRKQFNLGKIEEVYNTTLRQFTGFLVRTEGGRKFVWDKFGRAYICKIHMEQEKTDNKTTRYNLKRRLEEVLSDERAVELNKWNIKMVRGSGFMPL